METRAAAFNPMRRDVMARSIQHGTQRTIRVMPVRMATKFADNSMTRRDPAILAAYPMADITIGRIGELVGMEGGQFD